MDREQRFWATVRKWAAGVIVIPLLFGGLIIWSSFAQNKHQEYCTWTKIGEPYHIQIDGFPCRFTQENLINLAQPFLITGVVVLFFLGFFIFIEYRAMRKGTEGPGAKGR